MEKLKEQWINNTMNSLTGMQRAKPSEDVLVRIEQRIHEQERRVIPMYQLKVIAAAAVVLIILNTWSLVSYIDRNDLSEGQENILLPANRSLIATYSLYQ